MWYGGCKEGPIKGIFICVYSFSLFG